MALASDLTSLEKRTATLLTVIGILGSLLGIIAIATPFFLALIALTGLCDDACGNMETLHAQITHGYYATMGIIIFSIIVGFLPRIIYGIKLRKARRERMQEDDS